MRNINTIDPQMTLIFPLWFNKILKFVDLLSSLNEKLCFMNKLKEN